MQSQQTQTTKLPTWQPPHDPVSDEEKLALVRIINEAVWSYWKLEHRPCNLLEIYGFVRAKVNALRIKGEWQFPFRGKRTVDRNVNRAASPEFGSVVVAVSNGIYQPNPELIRMFEEEKENP